MYILKGRNLRPQSLITFIKLALCYLVFSSWPIYKVQSNKKQTAIPEISNKIHTNATTNNKLEKKLVLDLSKNDALNLMAKDLSVNVSLDVEGKIIGYRPFVFIMPSYWNSEVTKKIVAKNNSFSLSYKKDQIISFELSSI
tara:strand:+ start:178 stop:600 length:423 start_codon:yes stop_codon:yes gene_type:complete